MGKGWEVTKWRKQVSNFLEKFCWIGEQKNGEVSGSECGVENVFKGCFIISIRERKVTQEKDRLTKRNKVFISRRE